MREWLPYITQLYPGCGITLFNVWSVPFEWWLIYVTLSQEHLKHLEANRGK